MTTFMPSCRNRSARPSPIPFAPPVTTATRPRRSFMLLLMVSYATIRKTPKNVLFHRGIRTSAGPSDHPLSGTTRSGGAAVRDLMHLWPSVLASTMSVCRLHRGVCCEDSTPPCDGRRDRRRCHPVRVRLRWRGCIACRAGGRARTRWNSGVRVQHRITIRRSRDLRNRYRCRSVPGRVRRASQLRLRHRRNRAGNGGVVHHRGRKDLDAEATSRPDFHRWHPVRCSCRRIQLGSRSRSRVAVAERRRRQDDRLGGRRPYNALGHCPGCELPARFRSHRSTRLYRLAHRDQGEGS